MWTRKSIWLAVVVLVALALLVSIPFANHFRRAIEVKAYFENASGLQAGAPVRMAGVQVGRVTAVRVRPELKQNPAEVWMSLNLQNASEIPSDSVAMLATEGVLGATFVDLDIRHTSGAPLQNGGTLKTISIQALTPSEAVDKLSEALKGRCDPSPCPTTTGNQQKH